MTKIEQKVTVRKEIVPIFQSSGAYYRYLYALKKLLEKLNYKPGNACELFVFAKLDELVKYVDDRKTEATTVAELNAIIAEWVVILEQLAETTVQQSTVEPTKSGSKGQGSSRL